MCVLASICLAVNRVRTSVSWSAISAGVCP
uniref:Uncharacterized protein n=1 Tax=Zea mays TaxID=4577 RepID=C4J7L0_MAIZE|nr:unknown [Zea mays]